MNAHHQGGNYKLMDSDKSNQGPEPQSMESNNSCNIQESVDYIKNMTAFCILLGTCMGGAPCFVAARFCCSTKVEYENYEGDTEESNEATSTGECVKTIGKVVGVPVGLATGLFGCGISTVTAPCIGLFGQPKEVKESGEDAKEMLKAGFNCF